MVPYIASGDDKMKAVENKSVAKIRDGWRLCARRGGRCKWKWATLGTSVVMHCSVCSMSRWVCEPKYMTQLHGTYIHTYQENWGNMNATGRTDQQQHPGFCIMVLQEATSGGTSVKNTEPPYIISYNCI